MVDPASSHMLASKKTLGFGRRMAIFTISRVKNLSIAGPCANLKFREARKGNLVDPASSHMLVSKTKQFLSFPV